MSVAPNADDEFFMRQALAQAQLAQALGEVPVGAVVVRDGQVIAAAHNSPISSHDPSAHAEINALRAAAKVLGNYRLQDCSLYVTLEPCTMCSGALLNARMGRVVFGATEPRTGAAGSVHNVFELKNLNAQTQVHGGVLAAQCAELMQVFFKSRRSNLAPLRQDALRTPQACFEGLPNFPWPANFADDLPSLVGLRLHFVDEGARDALTFLCLHDSTSWGYAYRDALPIWVDAGQRVVLPDLIGFGKSDKPKKESTHTFNLHLQSLQALVSQLDLQRIVLVLPDAKDALGLSLPMTNPSRYVGLLTLDDTAQTDAHLNDPALAAPFPDKGHGSAIKPVLAMRQSALSTDVADFWQRLWHGRRLDLNLSAHAQGAAIAKESLKFFTPSIS